MMSLLARMNQQIPTKLKPVCYAIKNNIPLNLGGKGGGETVNARYCYSVWLRHLVYAHINGLNSNPECIAELGPGDSMGIGLAAIMSGANQYYALDLIKHFNSDINNKIFNEILKLYVNKEDIPGDKEFPKMYPKLKTYEFPDHILTVERLKASLAEGRIVPIKKHLMSQDSDFENSDVKISFFAPWYDEKIIETETVDMIISQAVLEHIDDLNAAYSAMFQWLKPGGYMSHVIDFTSHNSSIKWNGHWSHSDFVWRLIRGKSPYLINRFPHSIHMHLMKERGFSIIDDFTITCENEINRNNLSEKFKEIGDDDLEICGAFIQSVKP